MPWDEQVEAVTHIEQRAQPSGIVEQVAGEAGESREPARIQLLLWHREFDFRSQ
jgi:hypothetical protein